MSTEGERSPWLCGGRLTRFGGRQPQLLVLLLRNAARGCRIIRCVNPSMVTKLLYSFQRVCHNGCLGMNDGRRRVLTHHDPNTQTKLRNLDGIAHTT